MAKVKGKAAANLDNFAYELAEHIKHNFGMLRLMRMEEKLVAKKKTGSFCRKISTVQLVALNKLLRRISI